MSKEELNSNPELLSDVYSELLKNLQESHRQEIAVLDLKIDLLRADRSRQFALYRLQIEELKKEQKR